MRGPRKTKTIVLQEIVDKSLRNSVPLFQKWNCQIPWQSTDASVLLQCVPDMLDRILVKRACWPLHLLYFFRFKQVLQKLICMRPGIITHYKKLIANIWSLRYDMRSDYLICIRLGSSFVIERVQTEIELISEKRVTPIMLRPISMFICPISLFLPNVKRMHTIDRRPLRSLWWHPFRSTRLYIIHPVFFFF